MRRLVVMAAAMALVGCAQRPPPNTVVLTVLSEPPGAYITEKGTSMAGLAPQALQYPLPSLPKDAEGCFVVKGFDARWGSGASASTAPTMRLCGGGMEFHHILKRNPADPGLDKDLDFALKLQQRQDARDNAVVNGVAAGIAASIGDHQHRSNRPAPIRCTTRKTIGGVETNCD